MVSGIHGFQAAELHALRDRMQLADSVEFPGWVPREQLYDYYARASAFLYPSLFEGFGLPILEALAAGVPTACSASNRWTAWPPMPPSSSIRATPRPSPKPCTAW